MKARTMRLSFPTAAAAVAAVFASAGVALAAFSGTTQDSGNTFSAGPWATCTAPGTQVLSADADTSVWQDKASNAASATAIDVKSDNGGKIRRVLVHFPLPAIPSGCTVTSGTLKIYDSAGAAGRTINAYQAVGSWTEAGVLWATQPATTGSPVGVPSPAGSAWLTWTVTAEVQGLYAGSNDGFSIRDSAENGVSLTQGLSSREGATNKPELDVTFG